MYLRNIQTGAIITSNKARPGYEKISMLDVQNAKKENEPVLVDILIPKMFLEGGEHESQELLMILGGILKDFSKVEFEPAKDGQYRRYFNINLIHITQTEGADIMYQKLKAIGTIFDQRVIDYFEPLQDNETNDESDS